MLQPILTPPNKVDGWDKDTTHLGKLKRCDCALLPKQWAIPLEHENEERKAIKIHPIQLAQVSVLLNEPLH